jgi:hypothetical protein
MWTRTRDDVATKPKHHIPTKEFMWTIPWSPLGFPVVDKVATCATMDSDYFITNALAQLKPKMFPDG